MAESAREAEEHKQEQDDPIWSNTHGTFQVKTMKTMLNTQERQKLSKFTGDGSEDPVCHCKTCITIWEANGQDDQDYWLKAFPTTLQGIAIDWYTDLDAKHKMQWSELRKAFQDEFKLLRDDNEIVAEIDNT